jgi:hypothetical protein
MWCRGAAGTGGCQPVPRRLCTAKRWRAEDTPYHTSVCVRALRCTPSGKRRRARRGSVRRCWRSRSRSRATASSSSRPPPHRCDAMGRGGTGCARCECEGGRCAGCVGRTRDVASLPGRARMRAALSGGCTLAERTRVRACRVAGVADRCCPFASLRVVHPLRDCGPFCQATAKPGLKHSRANAFLVSVCPYDLRRRRWRAWSPSPWRRTARSPASTWRARCGGGKGRTASASCCLPEAREGLHGQGARAGRPGQGRDG